jgi:hypothetical protein
MSFKSILYLILFVFIFIGNSFPQMEKNASHSFLKPGMIEGRALDVNYILGWAYNDGELFYDRSNKSAGFVFPKGTLKTTINSSGLWIAGIDPDGKKRMSVIQTNQSEFQPGQINGTFNTKTNDFSVASNPLNEQYKIYKIVKKDSLAASNGSYDSWNSWPVKQGAPWIDVDGDGIYSPRKGDHPEFFGDQEMFWIYNDLNYSGHFNTSTGLPLGVEIHILMWGYDQQGALGNTVFCRYQIINKSDTFYNNTYISLFVDPDIGFQKDDLPGCDSSLNLGYAYNGNSVDNVTNGYYDKPPAVGADILQGPKKYTGNYLDSAKVNKRWVRGYKNLPLTSFSYFGTQSNIDHQPPLADSRYVSIAYEYMKGRRGWYDTTYLNPFSRVASKFPLSGDPDHNTGWLPNINRPPIIPQNIKILLSTGPFTFAARDTQEIICAYFVAQGNDNLNSVSLLKTFDEVVEQAYQLDFKIPGPPPQPVVKYSELPNEIILDWTSNDSTEEYNYYHYRFEGYNIYQSETEIGPWKRIATFDVENDVREIYDWQIDKNTGYKFWAPVAFGNDTGIKRNLEITTDALSGNPLINGKEYYYAVTSYSYNTDSTAVGIKPTVLENFIKPIRIVPHQPPIGAEIPTNYESILKHDRIGDDAVKPVVLLPTVLDGKTYQVTFNGDGVVVDSWNLLEKSSGDTLIKACKNFSGDNNSPTYNGFQVKVTKPASGVRRDTQNPPGWFYFNSVANKVTSSTATTLTWFKGQGNTNISMDAMDRRGLTYPTMTNFLFRPSAVPPDSILQVELRFSNKNTQRGYRYISNYAFFPPYPPMDSSFYPYVKRRGGGWVYQDYNKYPAPWPDTTFENPALGPVVPFTAWEIDSSDGDFKPRQVNVAFVEKNDSLWSKSVFSENGAYRGRGKIDGKWDPTSATLGGSEYLFIFKSTYSDTAKDFYTNLDLGRYEFSDVMYILSLRKAGLDSVRWNEGDILTISPNYPLHTRRVFEFVATKPSFDNKILMRQQLDRIKVFPNPYFGYNKAEKSSLERYVTFSNLPSSFKIRIFSLAGDLIRTIIRGSDGSNNINTSTFEKWDLKNDFGLYVASGIYLADIEIPEVGDKILKVAIIQPDQGLSTY